MQNESLRDAPDIRPFHTSLSFPLMALAVAIAGAAVYAYFALYQSLAPLPRIEAPAPLAEPAAPLPRRAAGAEAGRGLHRARRAAGRVAALARQQRLADARKAGRSHGAG